MSRRTTILVLAAALAGAAGGAWWAAPRPVAPPVAPGEAGDHRIWTCGMHPQVVRDQPGFCPICGMALVPREVGVKHAEGGERRILYWWDPMMSPPYISKEPGKSPMGMDLVPFYADQAAAGPEIRIDPAVVQNLGVRTAPVVEGELRAVVRAEGELGEAEPGRRDVNLRVSGWIVRLWADTDGMHLRQGDPLFDLYSPELQVGVDELIAARRAGADALYRAAERKLRLWDLPQAEIDRLARLEHAPDTVTFRSPITGHVVGKDVVQGAAVHSGERVLRLVDHSTLWLDAQIYERDLALVGPGRHVTATVTAFPGRTFEGEVSFVHPHVDVKTRTALARLVIANPDLALRPGMWAAVEIDVVVAPRTLIVPREAVIDTGTRQVAFVTHGEGHFESRDVTLGQPGKGGMVQVLAGLAPGETVVTSGQFLLDAESRLREAVQAMLEPGR
jgi:Cu(I)/Ag(I) efflux system membrane fusion protein